MNYMTFGVKLGNSYVFGTGMAANTRKQAARQRNELLGQLGSGGSKLYSHAMTYVGNNLYRVQPTICNVE